MTSRMWKRTFRKMIRGTGFTKVRLRLSVCMLRLDLCRPICELYKRKSYMDLDEQYKRRL